MQRVQTFSRTSSLPISSRFRCTLGRKSRLVRRFEWLTLCPKLFVLPQMSHTPAITGSTSAFRTIRPGSGRGRHEIGRWSASAIAKFSRFGAALHGSKELGVSSQLLGLGLRPPISGHLNFTQHRTLVRLVSRSV